MESEPDFVLFQTASQHSLFQEPVELLDETRSRGAAGPVAKDVKLPEDEGLSSPALLSVNEDGPSETAGNLEGYLAGSLEAKSEFGSEVVPSVGTAVDDNEDVFRRRALVDCKHEGCGQMAPEEVVEAHEAFCGYRLETSASPGCGTLVKKLDLEKHMEDSKDLHLVLLEELVKRTQGELMAKSRESLKNFCRKRAPESVRQSERD
jgi:hypothetical protein